MPLHVEGGLCGKIRIHSEMTEEELLGEVRSVFQEAMGNDTNFPFQFLQVAGGGSKTLTIPVLSASYTWTAKEVVKMAGQGCLDIQAQAPLKEYNCDSEADIDLTQDQVSTNDHTHRQLSSDHRASSVLYICVYCNDKRITVRPQASILMLFYVQDTNENRELHGQSSQTPHTSTRYPISEATPMNATEPSASERHALVQHSPCDRDKVLYLYWSVYKLLHM